ncbi:hypothetical protein M8756_17245 [Lutimaribacter sp. EGI FJ00015]|uniref:Uncharacterized protein n=1 Tax=Lutimaribacter degradans TaxID=2945989 RepID=A0ACC5ZZX8_9RHOB|nr:hypothetical protein [Lutimaribacter sp. EGI FJ00013]MCM2563867.1 hypothetical protein [Lutimaribacter sp. EGI FJ00013]MCO0615061.1 hypothetical protein [Lutimaribacter sp. EGI FJ00015]MCO0637706.1 hypothetical protein [Lutimaribacter sp. EGI FJ00014]
MSQIHRPDGPRRRLLGAFLLAVALMTGVSAPQARSPDRAVIRLSCPENAQPRDPLCRAMIQALAETAAGPTVIRTVARGDEAPTRPGDIGMALHVTKHGDGVLSGHLVWQKGPDGARQTGQAHRMTLRDTSFSPEICEQFTRELLKATPDLHATLTAP